LSGGFCFCMNTIWC